MKVGDNCGGISKVHRVAASGPKADAEMGFCGRGSECPPQQLGELGNAASFPAASGAKSRLPNGFLYFKCSRWHPLLHYGIICARSSA